MLYETPRLSFLKLDVNGHSGFFYFHPKLDFNAGDWEGTFVPQTSTDEKTIAIPAAWLHQGENTVRPHRHRRSRDATDFARRHRSRPHWPDLRRTRTHAGSGRAIRRPSAFTALVEPTIFYRDSKLDLQKSSTCLPMRRSRFRRAAAIELQHRRAILIKPSPPTNEFGELRFSFEVPEWSGAAEASVRLGELRSQPRRSSPRKSGPLQSFRTSISTSALPTIPRKSRNCTRNRSTRRWS